MQYNPQIHHRRSIRLKGYDYTQSGAYFITICCGKMECRFGNVVGAGFTPVLNRKSTTPQMGQPQGIAPTIDEPPRAARMNLNEFGIIAYNEWAKLPERFTNFELDVFQIMPNHMHGIIVLTEPATLRQKGQPQGIAPTLPVVGAGFTPALESLPENPTVGDIVGAYKSLVANQCLDIYKSRGESMGKLWQRNYHEHIIRNEKSYHKIANYITNNPDQRRSDKFYKE